MVKDIVKNLVKFTSKSRILTPPGKVTVTDSDGKVSETFYATPGLQFDRFVRDQWRNRPQDGEVTFVNDWKQGQMTVKVCKTGLANPTETCVLDYDKIDCFFPEAESGEHNSG